MFRTILIMLALCLATVTSQASLLGRAALTPGGTNYQAYYDEVYNLTWVADANLANTSGAALHGIFSWPGAQSWTASLNAANYLGTNTWRLPTANINAYGDPTGTGEMQDMYYGTLGNTGSLTNTCVASPTSGQKC